MTFYFLSISQCCSDINSGYISMIIARQSNIELWLNDILLVKMHYNQWLLKETVRKFSNQYFFGIGFAESSEHPNCVYETTSGQKNNKKQKWDPLFKL